MVAREQLNADNIQVIHYGFDFQKLSATAEDRQRVRAEFGFGSEFVIGCVARFFKNKGHAYLLSALKDLVRDIPDVRLLLLGDGDRRPIEKMIYECELGDRVAFAGYRHDVPACIKAMDIVVHPSLSEAFCQVIIEVMGVGTPLVATNVGGASEVVSHGETGMLVPPADSKAIARAVIELYYDSAKRKRVASAGQKSVCERFTSARMVDEHVDCYQCWLGASSKGQRHHVATEV